MTNADDARAILLHIADSLGVNAEEAQHLENTALYAEHIQPRIKAIQALGKQAMSPTDSPLMQVLRDPLPVSFKAFQMGVAMWMRKCFGPHKPAVAQTAEPTDDGYARNVRHWRFFEEVVETMQAGSIPKSDLLALVDYTYDRPVGVFRQEIGGVLITLAALCNREEVSMEQAGMDELMRISTPEMIEKIRAKQATKPRFSALPEAVPTADALAAAAGRIVNAQAEMARLKVEQQKGML